MNENDEMMDELCSNGVPGGQETFREELERLKCHSLFLRLPLDGVDGSCVHYRSSSRSVIEYSTASYRLDMHFIANERGTEIVARVLEKQIFFSRTTYRDWSGWNQPDRFSKFDQSPNNWVDWASPIALDRIEFYWLLPRVHSHST